MVGDFVRVGHNEVSSLGDYKEIIDVMHACAFMDP